MIFASKPTLFLPVKSSSAKSSVVMIAGGLLPSSMMTGGLTDIGNACREFNDCRWVLVVRRTFRQPSCLGWGMEWLAVPIQVLCCDCDLISGCRSPAICQVLLTLVSWSNRASKPSSATSWLKRCCTNSCPASPRRCWRAGAFKSSRISSARPRTSAKQQRRPF